MSDLIKREDAIKAVVSLHELGDEQAIRMRYEKYSPSVCVQFEETLVDVLNAIEDIPHADRPQGWIPCSERLPREYEVLCCDIYRNYIVGHPFADDSVSTGFCAENEGEFLYECVAWMPLPEPWKGADDE